MGKILAFLSGKKTYLLSAGALILAGLLQFGVITEEAYRQIVIILAPLGFVTLRAAVNK